MYCKVFDLTRPGVGVIMVHFNLHNADGSIRQNDLSHGFNVTRYDENGNAVPETGDQKIARMAAEFDNYTDRLMNDIELVDQHFDYLKSIAIGYRNPAAG